MPLSDFRDTYSWQEAINLGPHLVQLAEELPAGEQMGLAMQLRQEMVKLPAAIAYDLLEKDSFNRKTRILHLAATLDLIDKVYPALDTATLRKAIEKLTDRVTSDKFGETVPGAKPAHLPGALVAPAKPPISVPVIPEPSAADDHQSNPALKTPAAPPAGPDPADHQLLEPAASHTESEQEN